MTSYDTLSVNATLTAVTQELVRAFASQRFLFSRPEIDFARLKKAGWVCSILAESEDEQHRKQAQAFAILLHLYGSGDEGYDKLSYVILSRLGNLLSTKFLTSLFEQSKYQPDGFRYGFGQLLNIEMGSDRNLRIVRMGEKDVLTTDFQLKLWNKLDSGENIAISAPTSAGKSFIIQNFISSYYTKDNTAQGLYIVPTKALINQASDDLRQMLKDTVIRTSYIENESLQTADGEDFQQVTPTGRIIYVLTPERCMRLLQNVTADFYPSIIFIDEIQNIEDTEGRGALFEFVLESIATAFPLSKIITAGPFINNEKAVFEEIFDLETGTCSTDLPPVFQLQTIVRNTTTDKRLEIFINNSQGGDNFKLTVNVDFNLTYELTKNKGTAIAKTIVALTAGSGQQSIVYCAQTNYVESWALKMEQELPEIEQLPDELQELIDFIANEIHPNYYLIKCLKKKIAFHHSKLPDIVRKEVEDLFKQGDINILYCTSTLLQGVNLPAHNLFVTSPSKRNIRLSSFEFGNLIGRAGRIRDSLYGIIYCIEDANEEKQWAEVFYNSSFKKDIVPATRRVLQNTQAVIDNIEKLAVAVRNGSIAATITSLRHHYINSPEGFNKYLSTKKLNQEDILRIITPVSRSMETVSIPQEVLRLNPNIDPLLQDILYNSIKEEGVEQWVIVPNPNFHKRIIAEHLEQYKHEERSFYWQFTTLCEKLDTIFTVKLESYYKLGFSISVRQMAFSAFRWMGNASLKEIINEDILFHSEKRKSIDANSEVDINQRINAVISIHSKLVTFLLTKYFKLLSDVLAGLMTEEQAQKFKFTLSLPVMLELGSTESYVIQLISAGITRTVALQLFREFKKVSNFKEIDIFFWMSFEQNILGINKIFVRYLIKLGFVTR
jgi:superfamily II DNA/RNA helicase